MSSTTSTAGTQLAAGQAPHGLISLVRGAEEQRRLDAAARALGALAGAVVRSPETADALRGAWLGHALHPLLTDFPRAHG